MIREGHGEGSHGTMTLSLIGGYKPGQIIGPAYGSNFILAKTENTDSETPVEEDNWIAAMEWADSIGVDVTSTSLGYLAFDDSVSQYNYTWQNMDGKTARITKGAVLAARKGIVVVNSAGNEGDDPTHNTLRCSGRCRQYNYSRCCNNYGSPFIFQQCWKYSRWKNQT